MLHQPVLCSVMPQQPGLITGTPKMCPASSSLLFALEDMEEHSIQNTNAAQQHQANTKANVAFLVQPDTGCLQLVLDVRRLMHVLSKAAADSSVDVVEMASRLSAMGYRVTVRTALGGGPACFRNLRHEFLTVLGEGDYKDVPYIVDPAFKEQFEIPSPSASYAALQELLPREFVGTSSRLVPLVQNLCAEMVASFDANGLTLPPWRRAQSMLTKWLPGRSRDVSVSVNTDTSGSTSAYSGNSPSSSPVGADADAAGGSPFSRIDLDPEHLCRQGSGRSLLSSKIGSAGSASSRSPGRTSNYSSTTTSTHSSGSRSAGASQARSGATAQHAQQLLQQHQQARQLSQQVSQGAISRQPSLYQGQPPTYTVKMGAYAAQPRQ